jgi:hypothetical protein
MNTTNSSKRNKDSKNSEKDIQDASSGSVTNVGDTSRDITDTADVARASIAKGKIGGGDQGSKTVSTTTAADIARGQIEGNQSIIQGATTTATPNAATEEDDDNNISRDKVVSSGTSFDEDKSIDKADIYSTEENGTRHLERAQEKPVEKVEDKEKGSWRIKEQREEE